MKKPVSRFFERLKGALFARTRVLNSIDHKLYALESKLQSIEQRTLTVESLIRASEAHPSSSTTLLQAFESTTNKLDSLVHMEADRFQTLEYLVRTIEERSITLEILLNTADERSRAVEHLSRTIEQRSNTLEFVARQTLYAVNYQIDQLQKTYVDTVPIFLDLGNQECFNASNFIALQTDFPIAISSNDHIEPDSTTEGLSRPTLFVRECMRILGSDIKTLDLGTGAAGLVFEWAMNGVTAIGVDGSDFCRVNKIGYWPILENNLLTCDITRPFQFIDLEHKEQVEFNVITAWEVLEHIQEADLKILLENVDNHLRDDGYFIGSVSLVEYSGKDGIPYHVTIQPKTWWQEKFLESGLTMLAQHPFNEHMFYRGNGPKFQDFHNYFSNPADGFHFVARKTEIHRATEMKRMRNNEE